MPPGSGCRRAAAMPRVGRCRVVPARHPGTAEGLVRRPDHEVKSAAMSADNWQMTQNAGLPAGSSGARPATWVALALLLGAAFSAAVWLQPGPRAVDLAVDDLGQLLAAVLATVVAVI